MPLPREDLRMLETQMFGRKVRWPYAEHWFGWSVLVLRLAMGWTMFWAGIDKLRDGLDGLQPKWTADGFLTFAIHDDNPFKEFLSDMAGNTTDFLVVWGLTLTGLCLLTGFATRFAAFWAAVMMTFFWIASFTGPWFELEHGWMVDDHFVYIVLFFALGAFGAGRLLGVDRILERTEWVRKNRWIGWLLG